MTGYWPFWLGAPVLATLVLAFARLVGRPFGVSGSWTRLTGFFEQRAAARHDAAFSDDAALEAALLAATREEFGSDAISTTAHACETALPPLIALGPSAARNVFFLVSIVAGALLASLTTGGPRLLPIGASFERFAGHGLGAKLILIAGGVLVGFGARMAGGCTTGHGLSGCARLLPGSVLAMCSFFATAVLISFFVLPR